MRTEERINGRENDSENKWKRKGRKLTHDQEQINDRKEKRERQSNRDKGSQRWGRSPFSLPHVIRTPRPTSCWSPALLRGALCSSLTLLVAKDPDACLQPQSVSCPAHCLGHACFCKPLAAFVEGRRLGQETARHDPGCLLPTKSPWAQPGNPAPPSACTRPAFLPCYPELCY